MTTTARRCAGCAGPLPEVEPGSVQVKCSFCGVVNELDVAQAAAAFTVAFETVPVPAANKGLRTIGLLALAVAIAGSVGFGYFATFVANKAVSSLGDPINSIQGSMRTVARAVSAVRPSDLGSGASAGWKVLDVGGPPPTGWDRFDPVSNLAWATSIAQAWQPDAKLTRIDVKRLPDAGVLDLATAPETEAGYRFTSPAQIQRWSAEAAAGQASPKVAYELMVTVTQGGVKALTTGSRPSDFDTPPTAAVNSLTLSALLERAKRGKGFVPASFYDGYMIFNEREGWVWYFTGRGQLKSLPRVRSKDGAVYPYR